MRVLVATNDQNDRPGTEAFDWLSGFRSLGHEAAFFYYRKKSFLYSNFRRPWIRWMNRSLVRAVVEDGVDLLFVMRGGYIEAGALREIRGRSPCKSVCFFPDNPFGSASPAIELEKVAAYDLFVCKDIYFAEELRTYGFDNVVFLPHAYDPAVYESPAFGPEELAPCAADVAFIGSHYPYRERFLSGLTDPGVEFKIWGTGWEKARDPWVRAHLTGRAVWGGEKVKVLRASKILVDVQYAGNNVLCPDCKTVAFIGAGAFLLTNHKPEMNRVFEVGREVVTYRSKAELQSLIRHYLTHPEEREAIARRGQGRARADHTSARRIGTILGLLRVSPDGLPLGGEPLPLRDAAASALSPPGRAPGASR